MSQFVKGFSFSKIAAADLSAKKFLAAKLDSNGKVDVATANTDILIGVIEEGNLGAGSPVSVQFAGTAKMTAGGTLAIGDRVTATTGGKVIATTTDHQAIVGRYIGDAAAADGDVVEILLSPGALLSL